MAAHPLIPDYRSLDNRIRSCWHNFYRLHLLQGFTAIDAIWPDVQKFRQPQFVTMTDWYWFSWSTLQPHPDGPSWTPQSETVGPPLSVRIATPFDITVVNALLYAQAYPALHHRAKYKIRRTYNTGISRRRRNLI